MSVYGIEDLSNVGRDLALTLENDGAFYRAYFVPCAVRLQRLWVQGEYSLDLGIKRMRHAVDAGARRYHLEHGSMWQGWSDAFPKGDRDAVAEYLCRCLVAEWRLGNMLEVAK